MAGVELVFTFGSPFRYEKNRLFPKKKKNWLLKLKAYVCLTCALKNFYFTQWSPICGIADA